MRDGGRELASFIYRMSVNIEIREQEGQVTDPWRDRGRGDEESA